MIYDRLYLSQQYIDQNLHLPDQGIIHVLFFRAHEYLCNIVGSTIAHANT